MDDLVTALHARISAHTDFLLQADPFCYTEQKHLTEGSSERVYWHYGYMMACKDIAQQIVGLQRQLEQAREENKAALDAMTRVCTPEQINAITGAMLAARSPRGEMSKTITFTVLGQPQPQGSVRAFMVGGKPHLTSDNAKMKPWRQMVGVMALAERPTQDVWAPKHAPVRVRLAFFLKAPAKKRLLPAVKPDLDKLCRAALDSMTGILWVDDGQVVELYARKLYGIPARTDIEVEAI